MCINPYDLDEFIIKEELTAIGIEINIYSENGMLIPNNPVNVLLKYVNEHPISLSLESFSVTNGRHQICAAKKFGVPKLLVKLDS